MTGARCAASGALQPPARAAAAAARGRHAAASCQIRPQNRFPRLAPVQIVSSRGGQEALLRHSFWKARTALHCAARAGCAEALAAVIEVAAHRTTTAAGESLSGFLNAPDHAGDTALALACKHGHADCLRELLEAGALPLPANAQGTTPLHYAALRGHAACLRLLLSSYVRLPGARPAGRLHSLATRLPLLPPASAAAAAPHARCPTVPPGTGP